MTFEIYYRIGMAGEKSVLSHPSLEKAFHGICFSANVACFGRTWVSQFINRLGKPFFIDPISYVFQFPLQRISKGDALKMSFSRLVDSYGEPISSAVSNEQQIRSSDFNDDNISSMVENSFNFQKNIVKPESSSQMSLMEFGDWLDEETIEQEPEFLVIPYFWFDSMDSDWYNLNLKIIQVGKKYSKEIPIYGVICANRDIISKKELIPRIISDFNAVDGILLWLSDFNEYRIDGKTLASSLNFIQELSKHFNVIMMYGSYFSMIASKFGLAGMSPGIGISESKNVEERPTGGTFSNKYYIPQAKIMATDADARNFYTENPETLCKCRICGESEIHSSRDVHQFFDELTPLKAKIHYCLCRASELEEIERGDKDGIESFLSSNIEFCSARSVGLYNIEFRHQARWLSAVQEFG